MVKCIFFLGGDMSGLNIANIGNYCECVKSKLLILRLLCLKFVNDVIMLMNRRGL